MSTGAFLQALKGLAWLHYELSGMHVVDEGLPPAAIHDFVLAGARLHGLVGKGDTIGYHAGFEFAVGGTLDRGGFAYDVTLLPIGIGARIGSTGFLAFGTGLSANGGTPALNDAVSIPFDAELELGSHRYRFLARARASYVLGAVDRHDGAPSFAFADELDAMIGLRIGKHYEDYGYPSGNGYFGGLVYREMLGAKFAGLVVGYSIDLGTNRTQ